MTRAAVLVDADVLGRRRTGDESYVRNLLRELGAADRGFRVAAVARDPSLVPAGIDPVALPARSQLLRTFVRLPRLVGRLHPELAHFQYVTPPGIRVRSAVTVHDVSFEDFPSFFPAHDRIALRTLVPRSVRRAAVVFTVSEWTKGEIVRRYRVPPERVVVTPNGVDPAFSPGEPRSGDPGREDPYLLFVGAIQPRKDPAAAVECLARLGDGFRLVMVGPDKLGGEEIRGLVERRGLAGRVEFRGYVDTLELASLYRGAACLIFPSRYEGFGLPVLEAMASGTPVVATRAGAVPEVAGDAAVLVEPGDAAGLADAVRCALAERDRLRAAGLERAKRFTWAEAARATAAAYRVALGLA